MEGGFGFRLQYIQEEGDGEDDFEPERNDNEECHLSDEDHDGLTVTKPESDNNDGRRESDKFDPSTPRTVRLSFDSFDDGDSDSYVGVLPNHAEDQQFYLSDGIGRNVDDVFPFIQQEPDPREVECKETVVVREHHDSSFRFVSKTMFFCRMGIPYGTLDGDDTGEVPDHRGDQRKTRWPSYSMKTASWTFRRSINAASVTTKKSNQKAQDSTRQGNPFKVLPSLQKKGPLPGSFASAIESHEGH